MRLRSRIGVSNMSRSSSSNDETDGRMKLTKGERESRVKRILIKNEVHSYELLLIQATIIYMI